MELDSLPNEILLQIYISLPTISACHALASTSHHLHSLLHSTHRLPILYSAASTQYAPLPDAIRLITHTASHPPHQPRSAPPRTLALLKQIITVGRTANFWISLYPSQKWRGSQSDCRRFLTPEEEYNLRRACYRLWLYTAAFHTAAHTRTNRRIPSVTRNRAALLRPWPTLQLVEMLDLQGIFRGVLHRTICPGDSTVLRTHRNRFPDDPFPLVAVTQQRRQQFGVGSDGVSRGTYGTGWKNEPQVTYGMAVEGWGSELEHYYVVEDMLKLDPGQLRHLYEQIMAHRAGGDGGWRLNAGWSSKGMVESCLGRWVGDWFDNNGETCGETMRFVVGERSEDWEEVKGSVDAE